VSLAARKSFGVVFRWLTYVCRNFRSQRDDVGREQVFVISAPQRLALCRVVLTERHVRGARKQHLLSDTFDANAPISEVA
jgi:hypothetical protein